MSNNSSNPAQGFYILLTREVYPCATYPKGGVFTDKGSRIYETRAAAERVAKELEGFEVNHALNGNPYRISRARVMEA